MPGNEVNLLVNYPQSKRNVKDRGQAKSEEDRRIARRFGQEFFDGERKVGYGGFSYNPRFWRPVMPAFQAHFSLHSASKVLDVGCAKGFMLHDLCEFISGIAVQGIDISGYAVKNAITSVKPYLQVADARALPFADNSFDVVISINTVHNLVRDECAQALVEIERVSRGCSFITVDAYRDDEEKSRMFEWNLTAQTIMHVDEWKAFFVEVGYTGDYFWFIP